MELGEDFNNKARGSLSSCLNMTFLLDCYGVGAVLNLAKSWAHLLESGTRGSRF